MVNKAIEISKTQIIQDNKKKVEFSPLKKILGNIRWNRSENQQDMATRMGISKSYLSSIETGKRSIPEGFVKNLEAAYELTDTEKDDLEAVCPRSKNFTKIDLRQLSEDKKELINGLSVGEFDDETMNALRELIINSNKRKK